MCLGGEQAWWPSHWPEPRFGYDPSARAPLLIMMLSTLTWYICTSASDQFAVQRYWKEITGTQGISFIWAMSLSLMVEVEVGALVSLLPIGRRSPPIT